MVFGLASISSCSKCFELEQMAGRDCVTFETLRPQTKELVLNDPKEPLFSIKWTVGKSLKLDL